MSRRHRWNHSRFDQSDDEPLGPLANLVDLMLVFVCGLVAALVAISPDLNQKLRQSESIQQGRELPEIPKGIGEGGSGYQTVGKVYKDPETGRLILISHE
ncbi:hypothetical protein ABMA58_07940 [Oceanospirillum sp. HFRX-1_2]